MTELEILRDLHVKVEEAREKSKLSGPYRSMLTMLESAIEEEERELVNALKDSVVSK